MKRRERGWGRGGEVERAGSQHTSTSHLAFLQVKTLLGIRNANVV